MADSSAKGKRKQKPDKRNRQNQRTFASVQKRRLKHALAHGLKSAADIFAKRWVEVPTSKKVGSL